MQMHSPHQAYSPSGLFSICHISTLTPALASLAWFSLQDAASTSRKPYHAFHAWKILNLLRKQDVSGTELGRAAFSRAHDAR